MTAPMHDVLVEETPAGLFAHEPRQGHLTTACGDNASGYYVQPWYSVQHAGGHACTRCYPPVVEEPGQPRSLTEQFADLVDHLSELATNFDTHIEDVGYSPTWLRPGDDTELLLTLAIALAAGSLHLNAEVSEQPIAGIIANVRRGIGAGLNVLDGEKR